MAEPLLPVVTVCDSGDEEKPVVILFGWSGCIDRYLAKYADIWKNEGCTTIRHTLPLEYMVWKWHRLDAAAVDILRHCFDHKLLHRPVVFHLFSGAGCLAYIHFIKAWMQFSGRETVEHRIVGVVFDSCPAHTSIWNRADAYTQSLYPNESAPFKLAVFYIALLLLIILTFCQRILNGIGLFSSDPHYYLVLNGGMTFLPKRQLYLYSKTDTICEYQSIEQFMALQKQRGAEVYSICWPDSAHVDHYRAHSQQYAHAIHSFIDKDNN